MEEIRVAHDGKRIWTTCLIQNNTFFGPYEGDILQIARQVLDDQQPAKILEETDLQRLHLTTNEREWLPLISGARTKADQTLEMIRGPDGGMYFRTLRDTQPSEELRAWFCSSLSRDLGIVYENSDSQSESRPLRCQRCLKIFAQLNLLSAHALLDCTDSQSQNAIRDEDWYSPSSYASSTDGMSYERNEPHEEDTVDNDEAPNSKELLTSNTFSLLLTNPKLASLISSFSSQARRTGSESLADYHKKEFRKKFQGNEHYLRKHLYREGPDGRRISTGFLPEQIFSCEGLFTRSINKQSVKREKFDSQFQPEKDIVEKEKERCSHGNGEGGLHVSKTTRHDVLKDNGCQERKAFRVWRPFTASDEPENSSDHPGECNSTSNRSSAEGIKNTNKITDTKSMVEKESKSAKTFFKKPSDLDSNCIIPDFKDCSSTNQTERVEEKGALIKKAMIDSSREDFRDQAHGEHVTHPIKWLVPSSPTVSRTTALSMVPRFYANSLPFPYAPRYPAFHPIAHQYISAPSTQASSTRSTQGFTCDFCGKVYCRKYVLKIHMRTHTGFKPLKCKFCDKSFSDPSNMKKHVKLHETENTVHKCKHCGRSFVRYRGLLNHIKSKHFKPVPIGYIY